MTTPVALSWSGGKDSALTLRLTNGAKAEDSLQEDSLFRPPYERDRNSCAASQCVRQCYTER